MAATPLALSIEDRVGRLVLQRPETGNAFTGEMMAALPALLAQAAEGSDVLLIRALGADFCLGRDRSGPKPGGGPFDAFKLVAAANAALLDYPGIAVTEVQGRAVGFAVGMVMRSDIAIASDGARFTLDEVKHGIPPMFIMSEILQHLAPKAALDMVLSSRELTANEARDIGLVSRVVPADRLEATAGELVRDLRSRDPAVLRATKRYLRTVRELPQGALGAFALVEQTRFAERGQR